MLHTAATLESPGVRSRLWLWDGTLRMLARHPAAGLPPGVLNVVTGEGDTGALVVDHAGIGHFDAHRAEPVRDLAPVTFEPVEQSFELPPIGIQPDSKKSYLHNSVVTKHANI